MIKIIHSNGDKITVDTVEEDCERNLSWDDEEASGLKTETVHAFSMRCCTVAMLVVHFYK